MIPIPKEVNNNACIVLLPFLLITIVNKVIRPNTAVIKIVSPELYVFETSMLIPSPHNIAVEVNAIMQNGHLGRMTRIKNENIPNLPFGFVTTSLQLLQFVFIKWQSVYPNNLRLKLFVEQYK